MSEQKEIPTEISENFQKGMVQDCLMTLYNTLVTWERIQTGSSPTPTVDETTNMALNLSFITFHSTFAATYGQTLRAIMLSSITARLRRGVPATEEFLKLILSQLRPIIEHSDEVDYASLLRN